MDMIDNRCAILCVYIVNVIWCAFVAQSIVVLLEQTIGDSLCRLI